MSATIISKLSVLTPSPLASAWKHIFHSILKVPSDLICEVSTGRHRTSVQLQDGSEFGGELPVLAALQRWTRASSSEDASNILAFIAGGSAEEAAHIRQWVTVAARLASDNADVVAEAQEEAERFVSLDAQATFLTGSGRATVADVLMYAAIPETSIASSKTALSRWARMVASDAFVKPISRGGAVSSSTPSATSSGDAASSNAPNQQKPSSSAFTKPTAEEIEKRRLEKEKAKAEKEKAKNSGSTKAPAVNPNAKPVVAAPVDATGLDIRVGKITSISRHPEADKLYVETIDLGSEQRNIVSGLVDYYTAEELQGRLVLVVCNLKPKPLKGVVSQGMVLCASVSENGAQRLAIVSPDENTVAGTRVSFGGKLSETLPEALSNNVATELLSHLNTDASGAMRWKDEVASVPLGTITSTITSALVK